MRTSSFNAVSRRRGASPASGFTLMEMLVVMLLVGLTLGLGLSVSGFTTPAGAAAVERLAREFGLASEEAALAGEYWGLDFYLSPDGAAAWRWLARDADGWTEVPDARLAPLATRGTFPADSRPSLHIAGATINPEPLVPLTEGDAGPAFAAFAPEILLLPTRDTTPFELRLTGGDSAGELLAVDVLARIWREEPPALPR